MTLEQILNGVALVTVLLSIGCWWHLLRRMRFGLPLLPWEHRRPVPWGLVHLVGLFALLVVLQAVVQHAVGREPSQAPTRGALTLDDYLALLRVSIVSSILWVGLGLVGLSTWLRATAADLGWRRTRIARDVALGLAAFIVIAPVVYAIQFTLVKYWPSHHPLIEAIKQFPRRDLLAASFVSVVLVAPVFEELAFRLLLQGWLENVSAALVGRYREVAESDPAPDLERVVFFGRPASSAPVSLAEAGADGAVHQQEEAWANMERLAAASWPFRWVPILISSAVFALLHFSHGPDWVPLLVLALAQGYLYQRTHRILPCMIVHALLNGASFLLLLVELGRGP